AQTFPEICGSLYKTPRVLAIGDLHVENFGTWHDDEGRLVWGVNDFDEASSLPYTSDLVRLAASVIIARQENHLDVDPRTACNAIVEGYRQRLKMDGHPFVVSEHHQWLWEMLTDEPRAPETFWKKIDALYH